MIGARTRVFALLGDPVAHSLSPAMHNAAFHTLGLDAVYVALRSDADQVAGLMRALAQGGGGNVTVPHKRIAAAAAPGPAGQAYPTVNTFWGDAGRLVGADTDRIGILEAWRALGSPPGDWLVLGTGGSAMAAALAGASTGAAVAAISREPHRAAVFLDTLRRAGVSTSDRRDGGFVVNCTPLGLAATDPLPADPAGLAPDSVGLDLVYGRGATPWVRALLASGRRAADGRGALVGQGAAAFACWFPSVDPPVEVMHAAVRGALGPPLD